jgi:dihydrofolate reductase
MIPRSDGRIVVMAKIINSTFISLDGVINHMDRWHFDYLSDQTDQFAQAQLAEAAAMLMGRNTYQVYADAWPTRDGAYAERINALPKYVASTTLCDPAWNGTQVLSGDLVEEVGKLKQAVDGTILMHGVGPVAKTLLRNGLLDELHLWVHPVLAGVGDENDVLFTAGLHAQLETAGVQAFDNGVVVLSFRKPS